jgi:TPR repeat protein
LIGCLLFLLFLSANISAAENRDWQTIDGKEFKASFLLLTDDGKVRLFDDKSHKPIEIKFADLCEEDQEYVKGQNNPFQIDDAAEEAKKKEAEKDFVKIDWNTPVEIMMIQTDMGNPDACAWLGFFYEEGLKVKKDPNNAKFCYEKGAKLSPTSLGAKFCIAKLTKDQNEYEKIANQGFILAGLYVTREHIRDIGAGLAVGSTSLDKTLLTKAAEQGLPFAQRKLAIFLAKSSAAESAKWFRKAAEQCDAISCWNLANMYALGDQNSWMKDNNNNNTSGLKKDTLEAIKWYKKAWSLGISAGEEQLKNMLMAEIGSPDGRKWNDDGRIIFTDGMFRSKNGEYAKELHNKIRERAENGDAECMDILGTCYLYGVGGPKRNYEKAVEWFQKSAEKGNPVALSDLADCYLEGKGASQDKSKALEYYRKAASKGYFAGLRKVEKMRGFGFDKLRMQAENGTAEDKYKLGMRFLYGDKDVPQDKHEAILWLQRAARFDDSQWAADAAYQLGDIMSAPGFKQGFAETLMSAFAGREISEAKGWYEMAARKGHRRGQSKVEQSDKQWERINEDVRAKQILERAIRDARR